MEQTHVILLFTLCVIMTAHAQIGLTGAVDTDWLLDDPHKADRMPIWSQLLGNRGFGLGARLTNRRWNNPSGNSGNSWMQALQNLYKMILWRQMLNNQNNISHTTTSAPPRVTTGNKSGKNNGQDWRNRLQNFYRIALWNQLLSNQGSSNANGS